MIDKHLGRVAAYAEKELRRHCRHGGSAEAHTAFAEMVGGVLSSKSMSDNDRLSQIRCFYSALQTVTDKRK
ncbi:MAG: hypothetical protein ACI4EA_12480 [Candidatus Ornithomonoglobus sp.]